GDFDRNEVSEKEIFEKQYPVEIIHEPDQNKTDFEKGIEFLISRGFPAVNIIWATGKRMDHTLANLMNILKYKEKIKLVMLDDHSKIYPLLPKPAVFEKWYKAGTSISLLPVSRASGVVTENLLYPLQ